MNGKTIILLSLILQGLCVFSCGYFRSPISIKQFAKYYEEPTNNTGYVRRRDSLVQIMADQMLLILPARFQRNGLGIRVRDSLARELNLTSHIIPTELKQTTLIVEDYSYEEFLRLRDDKYFRTRKSWYFRKSYLHFRKQNKIAMSQYIYKWVDAKMGSYDTLDTSQFRYVLRYITMFTEVKQNQMHGFDSRLVCYIWDRKLQKPYSMFGDIHMLLEPK